MNHEVIAEMCEEQRGAEASSPFGPQTVVYKVAGKMFALLSLNTARLNVKCDPEYALKLRERHHSVEAGYHMSKRHWNSIYWEREVLNTRDVKQWIDDSYKLVVKSLPKAKRLALSSEES